MESFVADVRLVFSNSDKYNLVITRLSLLDFKTTCSVLNLPTKATLGTEGSGLCREVLKKSQCMDCSPKNVAVVERWPLEEVGLYL